VVALDNKKLFIERMKRERMQRDMELASEVQAMLVPTNLPQTDRIQVGALYLPRLNIGGDYFDFIRSSDHEFLWCIADVTGKGISAALLMANLQASLRAWSAVENNLTAIVKKLNSLVVNNTNGERFITLFIGRYNELTREMQYINAGHNPPFLLMGDKTFTLKSGTTIIGAFDELPFIHSGSMILEPGSLIFNYTDGLVESPDENVFVSDEDLLDMLITHRNQPARQINQQILQKIQSKFRAKMNSDDITMLTIRIV
jgi:sigma-B regulation protein RsbU (phosphoserine phosphatase)